MAKSTSLVQTKKEEKQPHTFEWGDEKERALELIIKGLSKEHVSKEIGVHRNTVSNWLKQPLFVKKLKEALEEFATTSKLRRIHTTVAYTDSVTRLATKSLMAAEKKPTSGRLANRAGYWLGQFRSLRNEERLNFGESTDNRNVSNNVHHSGHVSTSSRSFKEYLKEQAAAGVIDAEIVGNQENGAAGVIEAVQQLLVEGEYLREIDKANSSIPGKAEEEKGGKDE